MTIRKHGNNLKTTLNGAITNSATSITLTSTAGFPSIGTGETYRLTLAAGDLYEIIEVTDDNSAPTLTVTRGMEGTTALAWANGTFVGMRATADSYDRKADKIIWTVVTGTTQAMEADNGYIANNAALVVFTLPTTAYIGATLRVIGLGAGGWKINAGTGQQIRVGTANVGVGGGASSTNRFDSIELICYTNTPNFGWTASPGPQGSILLA